MKRGLVAAVAGLGLVLLATGILLGCYGFPALVHEQIKNLVVIRDGSEAYSRWQKLPQPLNFKVYIFNVTNPDEVAYGERPNLNQIGPYHYDQYREHINIIDQPKEEALLAEQKETFFFNKEKSGDLDENDVVTVLNVALLGTALKVKQMMPFALNLMNPVLKEIFPGSESPFQTTTVAKFLFDGIVVMDCSSVNRSATADLVCQQAPTQLPRTVRQDEPDIFKFSMFHYKNVTRQWFKTKRGLTNSSDLGRLIEWNNKTTIQYWKNPYCNMINGTDSTVFPPFQSQDDNVYIFAEDLCRSVYAVFERKSKVEGIPVLRYIGYEKLFSSGKSEPENECFCDRECLEDGVMDLTKCHDAPVIASFPHFYLASETYKNYVIGLNPKKELHETYIDIEQKAGTPMRGAKRVQLNLFMTKISQLDAFRSVSEGLFPVLWVEEGAILEGSNLQLVQNAYKKLDTLDTVKWIIVGVGLAALVGALFLYCSQEKGESQSSCCGKRKINTITDVSPKNQVSITTIDGLLRRDTSLPVQTFPAMGETTFKRSHMNIFN